MNEKKTMPEKCSTCRKPLPEDCTFKTCPPCRERSATVREENRKKQIKCKAKKQNGEKCTNKVSYKCGNIFCEKHLTEWKEHKQTGGKIVNRCNSRYQCDPENPGIKAILPKGYTKKKCESCSQREREKDHNKRGIARKANKKIINTEYRICEKCPLDRNRHKIEEMGLRSDGKRSRYCQHHFNKERNVEKNREYRDRRENINDKYTEYKKSARRNNREFDIPFDKFGRMLKSKCYYCGCYDKKSSIVGIDRLDNDKGYIKGNIVPCCIMCNLMKNCLNEATFILFCVQIARHHKMFVSKSYSYVFNKYQRSNYRSYKKQTKHNRRMVFELTQEEFENLRNNNCYLCGRCTDDDHCNGIDRKDNDIGYTVANSKSCCADCNVLKKIFDYNEFVWKCVFIAHNNKHRLEELEKIWIPSGFFLSKQKKDSNSSKNKKIIEV